MYFMCTYRLEIKVTKTLNICIKSYEAFHANFPSNSFYKKRYTMEMTSHVHACVRAYVFRLATTIRH